MKNYRKPYPELDCALAMSRARGNLNFLVKHIQEKWDETMTTANAIRDAHTALVQAQKEYDKVLTLISINKPKNQKTKNHYYYE